VTATMRRLLATGLVLAFAAEPLAAQYGSSVPGWGNFSRMRQHFSTRAAVRASTRSGRTPLPRRPTPGPDRRADAPAAPSSAAGTSFRPQAPALAPALMAAMTGGSAAERRRTEQSFTEVLGVYRERLRAAGGDQNNVARAAAFLIANSYEVHSGSGPLSQARFDSLRRQLERALAADPDFARKSDRDRQIEFELYAILGTAVLLQDESQRERLRRLARENLEGVLGVAPERIAITDEGLEVR
jgi:hypothetical protein